MTCHVFTIRGPSQSGKTTLALGALERLYHRGYPVAYVVPGKNWVRDAQRRTIVPCLSWHEAVNTGLPPECRAVVVDDANLASGEPEGLARLREALDSQPGPTQLILVYPL